MSAKDEFTNSVKMAKDLIKDIITSSQSHNSSVNIIIEQIATQIEKLKNCVDQIDNIKLENKKLEETINEMRNRQENEIKELKEQNKGESNNAVQKSINESIQNIKEIIDELNGLSGMLKNNRSNQINKLQENVKTITRDIGTLCNSAKKLNENEGDDVAKAIASEMETNPVLKSGQPGMDWGIGGFRYGEDLDRILRNSPLRTLNNKSPSKKITLNSKSKTRSKSIGSISKKKSPSKKTLKKGKKKNKMNKKSKMTKLKTKKTKYKKKSTKRARSRRKNKK